MKVVQTGVLLCGLLVVLPVRGDDGWRWQVGGVHQWGMKMSLRGAPVMPAHDYSIPPGGFPAPDPAGADLADPLNQTYVDGYVRRDYWMDVPSAPPVYYAKTWNWSYQSYADQYNAADQTLAFHRQVGSVARSTTGSERFDATGVELTARHDLAAWSGLDLGLDLALAWFPGAQAVQQRAVASRYNTYYYRDDYDGTGVVPGLGSSYRGPDYYNSADADAPPIDYHPIRITDTVERTDVSTRARVSRVRGGAGLELQVELSERFRLYARPQLTLSLVRATVEQTVTTATTTTTLSGTGGNTVATASSRTGTDQTGFLVGFLLAAGFDYTIAPGWVVGAYFGQEWIPSELGVRAGSDRVRLNLSGAEASCYIGVAF